MIKRYLRAKSKVKALKDKARLHKGKSDEHVQTAHDLKASAQGWLAPFKKEKMIGAQKNIDRAKESLKKSKRYDRMADKHEAKLDGIKRKARNKALTLTAVGAAGTAAYAKDS